MSLIITIHTNEGIVMASDSRITYNRQDFNPLPDGKGAIITDLQGIHYSDTTYKTYRCPNNAGISTCGDSSINGKPIAGYIESFIDANIKEDTKVSEIPQLLLDSFRKYTPVPSIVFHVAGYELQGDIYQKLYRVFTGEPFIEEIDTATQGAAWNGETGILSDIITPHWVEKINEKGEKSYIKQIPPSIPWNFFSLQDAVDFSVFAMNTTMETMRFQERLKTVGGPIDILAIKPTGSFWIKRKELNAN